MLPPRSFDVGGTSYTLAPELGTVDGPAYRATSGALAVPTGRIFVRFAESVRASARGAELAAAGFHIEQLPDWAPHTAWCRAADESIATALSRFHEVERLPDVERVEPELLRARAQREPP